jgi:DNA-binding MarR family transcriptional regulator
MTNRIDRLEERNLVERFDDPNDRRALRVHLTQEGLRLVDEAIDIRLRVAQELTTRLTQEEMHELARMLRKLLLAIPEEVVPGS